MDNSSKKRKRKKILIALMVMAWLLLLGFISYCVCLPDLEEVSASLKVIREDPNLTPEQKFEQTREVFSKLAPSQRRRLFQIDKQKLHHETNREMQKFLKMSPEELVAYVKKMKEERKKFGPKGVFAIGGGPIKMGPGGPGGAGKGGAGGTVMAVPGGPGGKGAIFFGPAGAGGPGGGKPNPSQMQKSMLDDFSPETRAGMSYQRGLR